MQQGPNSESSYATPMTPAMPPPTSRLSYSTPNVPQNATPPLRCLQVSPKIKTPQSRRRLKFAILPASILEGKNLSSIAPLVRPLTGRRIALRKPPPCYKHRQNGHQNMKSGFVYILASKSGVLYIGVTSKLGARMQQHREKQIAGFTRDYNVTRLVYFELFGDIRAAIAREKQLKGWRRSKKVALIQSSNPTWRDLAEDIFSNSVHSRSANPPSSPDSTSTKKYKPPSS
jgi:putative endonuclease